MMFHRMLRRPEWLADIAGYGSLGLGLVSGVEGMVGLGFVLIVVAWPVHFVRWRQGKRRAQRPATVTRLVGREARRAQRRSRAA